MMQGPVTTPPTAELSLNQTPPRVGRVADVNEGSAENSRFAETLKREEGGRDSASEQVEVAPEKPLDETQQPVNSGATAGSHAANEPGKELPEVASQFAVSADQLAPVPVSQVVSSATTISPATEGVAEVQAKRGGGPGLVAGLAQFRPEVVDGKSRIGESSTQFRGVVPSESPLPVDRLTAAVAEASESVRSTLSQREAVGLATAEQALTGKLVTNSVGVNVHTPAGSTGMSAAAPTLETSVGSPSVKSAVPIIDIPMSDSRWGGAVAQRAVVAIQQGLQHAQISINPAQLGPIDLQLQLQDEKASVTMISPHAAVRELLEAATPRLRDMLEQQGMSLDQSLVSDQSPWNSSGQTTGQSGAANENSDGNLVADEDAASNQPIRQQVGLVDHYA